MRPFKQEMIILDNFVTEELGLFSPLYLENKIIDITHHQENSAVF